jgi:7-carboxy-7-deazaguanine synthase
MMTAEYIGQSLRAKGASRDDWITLSGGNPALFVDEALVDELVHTQGFRLAMETQGSVDLKDHVSQDIECLVVSPKPPSSGMHTRFKLETVIDLLYERMSSQVTAVKFVAFNAEDLDWCHLRHMEIVSEQHRLYKGMMVVEDVQWFLSVGTPLQIINDSPEDLDQIEAVRLEVCKNLSRTWLATLDDPFHRFRDFRILPQLHTLVWGQKAGV